MRRLVKSFLILILLAGIVWGGVEIYRIIQISTEGEFNLHASDAAVYALEDFMVKEKRWPKNLEEFRAFQTTIHGSMFDWPEDEKEILSRVDIKFGCRLEEIAKASPENFPWLRCPKGIYRERLDRRIKELITVAKEQLKGDVKTKEAGS